jgi:hypothetical protein
MNIARTRFHSYFALAVSLLIIVGFFRTFYARPWFDLPPLPSLMVLHGIVFTTWLVLFVVQTQLVATRRVAVHRKLGIAGAVLALAVIVIGVITALKSAAIPQPRPLGMSSQQFSIVALTSIALFAVFIVAAIALRRKPEYHRRLMVFAMISVLGPPIARLLMLFHAGRYFLIVQSGIAVVLVMWCLINDWRKQHIVHPIYVVGGLVVVLSWPLRIAIGQTETWMNISGWLMRTFNG